jgi:hypothetical protein
MMATMPFLLGCNGRGAMHLSVSEPPLEEQFRLVKDSSVFDYFDRLPQPHQVDEYICCSSNFGLPIHTGTWYYMLGRDDALIEQNLDIGRRVGAVVHNILIFARHADGHVVTDDEIVDNYLRHYDAAGRRGMAPTYELHVDMWSEDFRRVASVATKVQSRGIPFNFCLDYSHVTFKIDNPEEQNISGIRDEVLSGAVVLDPFERNSLCDQWLQQGIVFWAQFRPAAPNGPKNIWARDENGNPGRGIQYPFLRPKPGEWHSEWLAYKVEPGKQAMRRILKYHLDHPRSPLRYITTEMINLPDYGLNSKYSLIEHNAACAKWIRDTWAELVTLKDAEGKLHSGSERE